MTSTIHFDVVPRLPEEVNHFERVGDDLIVSLYAMCVEAEPKSYATIGACCKRFKRLRNDPQVASKVDVLQFKYKAKSFNRSYHDLVKTLANLGNKGALLVIGTQYFFNLGLRTEGEKYLFEYFKYGTNIGRYVYSLAVICNETRKVWGIHNLKLLMDTDNDMKLVIRTCRNFLREILSEDGKTVIPAIDICKSSEDGHWDHQWVSVHKFYELFITCRLCWIDIETFKVRSGFK